MYRLFTKPFSNVILPIIKKVYPVLLSNELVSVQPMNSPSVQVFPICFKKCSKMFELYEELWLEDFKNDELWCPQTEDDCFVDDYVFKDMRRREFVLEDWEIDQFDSYIEGIGNKQKELIRTRFKAMWFPEK